MPTPLAALLARTHHNRRQQLAEQLNGLARHLWNLPSTTTRWPGIGPKLAAKARRWIFSHHNLHDALILRVELAALLELHATVGVADPMDIKRAIENLRGKIDHEQPVVRAAALSPVRAELDFRVAMERWADALGLRDWETFDWTEIDPDRLRDARAEYAAKFSECWAGRLEESLKALLHEALGKRRANALLAKTDPKRPTR